MEGHELKSHKEEPLISGSRELARVRLAQAWMEQLRCAASLGAAERQLDSILSEVWPQASTRWIAH